MTAANKNPGNQKRKFLNRAILRLDSVGKRIQAFSETENGSKILRTILLLSAVPTTLFLINMPLIKKLVLHIPYWRETTSPTDYQHITQLLFLMWILSLVVVFLKSIFEKILPFSLSSKGPKGLLDYWEQALITPFFNIFTTVIFSLGGISVAQSSGILTDGNHFAKSIAPMNIEETLLYRAALLASFVYVIMAFYT